MSYMLLIVEPVGQRAERGVEQGREDYAEMVRFGAGLQERGILKASNSLASTRTAVRLQRRKGKQTLIDGPFAEAKELVGGYFVVDVRTKEEALAIAATCPAAEWATIEVREVAPCYQD